jgi:type IV secretion system protein VirB10
MHETQQPENRDREDTHQPQAHFKMATQVAPKPPSKILIGGLMGVVVMLLLWAVASDHSSPTPHTTDTTHAIDHNPEILQQNEAKLRQWQVEAASMNANADASSTLFAHSADKALQARFNAPTQVYAAMPNNVNSTSSTPSASNTLADNNSFAQFANAQANAVAVVTGTRLSHPEYTIADGEFIQAVLETAMNSDLPGMVRAVITQPVYSFEGEHVLIPAGSRLVGHYTSTPTNGAATTRIFVVWNRVLTPDGISIMINSPGTDALGTAGMGADAIETHVWQQFGSASLLSILGATSANLGVSSETQANSANAYQQSIANAFQQSAQTSLGQNDSIQPTLHVNQGDAVTVFVANDIDLYAVVHRDRDGDEDNTNNLNSAPSPSMPSAPSALSTPHTDGVVFP